MMVNSQKHYWIISLLERVGMIQLFKDGSIYMDLLRASWWFGHLVDCM